MSDAAALILAKLRADGAAPPELAAMERRLAQLDDPSAGLLAGDELEPVGELPRLEDLPELEPDAARAALDGVVVLRLNGGLGTSMGLSGPKSSLEVKPGRTFLDVIATQVLALRERHGARLPLLLMDSSATRGPSLERLGRHAGIAVDGVPLDFLQGREPKLRADTREPVEWPADPALEWCPPGHGDLYVALAATGTLERLLDAGFRHLFASNADNLGALADPRIAAWLRAERVPFALEAVRGTPADRKGGHLATRSGGDAAGRLVLRETAQVPDGDASFADVERWRFYNTNNLWVDLQALRELQAADPGAPALPLIVNRKTVDPADPASPAVLQLETAMGAAVSAMPGAQAIEVPRSRFAPVKTTDDLLVIRSDAYALREDGRMEPTFTGAGPFVALDAEPYKLLAAFEERFAAGAPSLRDCTRLVVRGDVCFGAGVVVRGDVELEGPRTIADGAVLEG